MPYLPQPPRGSNVDQMDKVELSRWYTEIWKAFNNLTITGGTATPTTNLISEQTLTSDQSSVTFSALDSTVDGDYTLVLTCLSGNATAAGIRCRVNGDSTAGHYESRYVQDTATGGGPNDYISAGYLAGNAGTNGCTSVVRINSINGLTTFDSYFVQILAADRNLVRFSGRYTPNSTITSLELTLTAAGLFKTGSTFRLYGSNTNKQVANLNIEGGSPESVYLTSQTYDGGSP